MAAVANIERWGNSMLVGDAYLGMVINKGFPEGIDLFDGIKYVLVESKQINLRINRIYNIVAENDIGECFIVDTWDCKSYATTKVKMFDAVKDAVDFARNNKLSGFTVCVITKRGWVIGQ